MSCFVLCYFNWILLYLRKYIWVKLLEKLKAYFLEEWIMQGEWRYALGGGGGEEGVILAILPFMQPVTLFITF